MTGNNNPLLLSVLNGGIIPTAELALRLRFPLEIDSIKAGRYQGETRGNEIRWLLKPTIPLRRRTVLIIDDVLDEGITLAEIRKYCIEEGAEAVYTAVIVDKKLKKEAVPSRFRRTGGRGSISVRVQHGL